MKIVLLKGSTEVGTIADSRSIGSDGKGSYSWQIASSGSGGTGSDYKVSIQSISQPSVKDTSNTYFTITSGTVTPAITVTSPKGGDTWNRGTTQTIAWDYTGSPGSTVKIVLLKGSSKVGTIADNCSIGSDGKGSYSWQIASSGSGGPAAITRSVSRASVNPQLKHKQYVFHHHFRNRNSRNYGYLTQRRGHLEPRNYANNCLGLYRESRITVKIVLLKGSTEVGTIADSCSIGSNGKGSYSWQIASSGPGGPAAITRSVSRASVNPQLKTQAIRISPSLHE